MHTLPNGVRCTGYMVVSGETLMVLGEGGVRMGVPVGSALAVAVRSNLPETPYVATPEPLEIKTKEFLDRLTNTELIAILAARKDSPELDLLVTSLLSATHVGLDNPETIAGLDTLVAAGLLTAARVSEILAPP